MLALKLRADQELVVSEELNLNLACPDVVPSYIHTPYAYWDLKAELNYYDSDSTKLKTDENILWVASVKILKSPVSLRPL